jgi:hypothetical protein
VWLKKTKSQKKIAKSHKKKKKKKKKNLKEKKSEEPRACWRLAFFVQYQQCSGWTGEA